MFIECSTILYQKNVGLSVYLLLYQCASNKCACCYSVFINVYIKLYEKQLSVLWFDYLFLSKYIKTLFDFGFQLFMSKRCPAAASVYGAVHANAVLGYFEHNWLESTRLWPVSTW